MTDKENTITKSTENEATSESRRAFLKKAGAFALYAPPAITLLSQPSHASIMSSPGGNHDGNHYYSRSHGGKHSSRSYGDNDGYSSGSRTRRRHH